LKTSGAGRNLAQASAPAVLIVSDRGRVLVYSYAAATSGTPSSWAAAPDKPGVNFLPALSDLTAEKIGQEIALTREPGDVVIVSIHWGPNWVMKFRKTNEDLRTRSSMAARSLPSMDILRIIQRRLRSTAIGSFFMDAATS
jgi:poly-gamma-glutamate capsule biosynthesis protein CapA/YwtB (metallophosphatase superfamily)